jgi:predicted GNAT family acetyltransferase
MNLEIYNWNSLPEHSQYTIANLVALYTQGELGEKPQMLPLTTEDVWGKFTGAVAMTGEEFMGYVAAAKPTTHLGYKMSEVGSLWVPSEHRGQGVAHELVQKVSQDVQAKSVTPFAFCNPLSLGVFLGSNYVEAKAEEIPPDSFGLCSGCPMQPKSGCCDTTVLYKGGCHEQ